MKEKEEQQKKRNTIYRKIKRLKPEVKFLLTVVTLLFIGYFANGYIESYNEKQRIIRLEEDRMVEHTLENYEGVRKIEFTSFEQNFPTEMWSATAIVNDDIYISYDISNLGENNKISMNSHIVKSEGRKLVKKKEKSKDTKKEDIEVIYKKG